MFGGVTTAAQLMVKVGADVSDAQSKLRGMSATFNQFGKSAMAIGGSMSLGVTLPLVTAGLAVTKFASDLSESTNKAKVVFGEQAAAIEKWSQTSAKAFGLSRQQAMDAAGTFGNLFTSMGLAVDQSSQMSQGLVQLAADLASFNNIDPGVALEKLRAGMVGEVEPLRTLGISLSAAAVEAKAFEMGLAATAAQLTEADKAAARYALIVQQSANAQGDFARTADGLANQTRIVKAQLADAAATIGAQLLPYVQKLVEFVSQVVDGFTNLDPQIQTFIIGAAAVAAAIGPAVTILGAMATAIGALVSPIGLVVAAIVGLAAVVVNHFGGIQATTQALADLWTNTLQPAFAVVWEFIQSNVIPIFQSLATVYIALVKKELELLAAIWTNVLQPALATVWEFIQSNVIPILQEVGVWLANNIPEALQTLADFWTNVLQPALATVWEFIQSNVIPIFQSLATVYIALVKKELELLAEFWQNILLPAIEKVWAFVQNFVAPLLAALANVYIALVKKELELLAGIWQNIVLPAIKKVWEFIENNVLPVLKELARIAQDVVGKAFETLSGIVRDNIGPALLWFKDNVVDPVAGAISAIGSAVSGVIGWLNNLASTLAGIKLPDWLTPGSPTPFEYGLLGINRALQATTKQGLTDFTLGLDNLGTVIKEIVELFRQLAIYFADPTKGIGGAQAASDALQPIFDNLTTIMDALQAILDMSDMSDVSAKIDQVVAVLRTDIPLLVAAFVDVAKLFSTDALAAAVVFADAAGKIVAPLRDMVDAFTAVALWVPAGLGAAFGGLLSQLRGLARLWKTAANGFDAEMLEGALWFAGIADALVAPLTATVEGFKAVARWVPTGLGAAFGGLLSQLRGLAKLWKTAANGFDAEMLEGALWFASIAGTLVAPIKAMVDAFNAVAGYKPVAIGPTLNTLFDQLRGMVRKLVRLAAEFDQEGVAAAAAFMEAVSAMLATLSDAMDLLTKIKTYVSPSANALLAFERDVEDMLLRFSRWVVFVIQPIAAGIDREAMQAMEDMVNALAAALELLDGLVDYVAPSAASLTAFMDGVQQLAEDFVDWAQTNGPQLFKEIPPEFLAAFRDVFEGLSAAVDVLTALVGFVAPSVLAVMQFEEGYQRLFMDWLTWVQNNFSQTKNDLLIAIAAVFSQVMEGLRTAVEVLTALIDFVPPSAYAVMTFEEGYQRLFRDWVTWATGTFAALNVELVAAVASVFGDVFNGIGAAVATLTALSGYVSPGLTAIIDFETDYQRLFTGFVNWVETTFTDITSDVVVAMAGAASALFQGLGAAATTLTQITGYIGPTDATIAAFEEDYQRIATDFATWAETSWTEEMAATTTAVGNAVNALYQGLGTAVTTLSLIRNYTPASQAVIDRFMADMTNVMGTMLAWVETSFGVDAQAIMTSFGNTTQALFSGLGTALDVLQGIAAYTVPDSQFVLALQRFNDNLLTAITSWQIWLTNTFTPETAALVQQFHTILSGIVADMRAALELLMDIDQAQLPTADDLIAFLEAVAQLFDGVIDLFGGVTTEISGLVQAMADAFQEIFDTIEAAVDDFGGTLYAGLGQLFATLAGQMWAWGDYAAGMFMSGLLAGMQNINSQNAVIEAMRDLAEQLEAELRIAWGIGSPSKVAERIGGFFVSGLARGLEDLDQIPNMIQRSLAMDGVTLGADVRYSPAPRHDYLTVAFEGAWQTGMSPAEEKRITSAMVGELRRQGLALQVARV